MHTSRARMRGLPVNDLGTTEHVGTSYLWRAAKRGQRAHIQNPTTGQAYCQAENCSGGKAFDGRGSRIPDGRRLCQNCADLAGRVEANYREPNIKVLLGERLAETEPELFAGTVVPKRRKRKLKSRPAHRPRGRKPPIRRLPAPSPEAHSRDGRDEEDRAGAPRPRRRDHV